MSGLPDAPEAAPPSRLPPVARVGILVALLVPGTLTRAEPGRVGADTTDRVVVFVAEGCPHCAEVESAGPMGACWGSPSLATPEVAKPNIYARTRRIVTAERLAGALGTVVVLALMVHTLERLWTTGLPALYTQILSLPKLSTAEYYG